MPASHVITIWGEERKEAPGANTYDMHYTLDRSSDDIKQFVAITYLSKNPYVVLAPNLILFSELHINQEFMSALASLSFM